MSLTGPWRIVWFWVIPAVSQQKYTTHRSYHPWNSYILTCSKIHTLKRTCTCILHMCWCSLYFGSSLNVFLDVRLLSMCGPDVGILGTTPSQGCNAIFYSNTCLGPKFKLIFLMKKILLAILSLATYNFCKH